jgi:hypothetical protein
MENKPARPRLKISIFDIVIIAVVIVAAGALIFVWRMSGKSSDTAVNARPVHYTIELNGMVQGTAGKIGAGDTIIDGDKKFVMGTVQSVTIGPATSLTPNRENGDTLQSVVPGKEMATIVLVCDCSSTDANVTAASGYVVKVGTEVHAVGPGYAGIGYIIAINREDLG